MICRNSETFNYVQLDLLYDYTEPEYEWYTLPMKQGPMWVEPYFCSAGITLMTTYSSPFYTIDKLTNEKIPMGVVTIDISMDEIKRIVESLDLGPSGFGALISKKGNYLYHPNNEFVIAKKNIVDVAKEYNDQDRLTIAEKALRGEGGIIDHISATTGRSSWLVYEPICHAGWSLQNTFIKDDLPMDFDTLRRQKTWIYFMLLIFILSFSSAVLRVYKGREKMMWLFSGITSILFLVGIGYIWHLTLSYPCHGEEEGVKVTDKATLHRIMNKYIRTCAERNTEKPIFIPTGIFVESIKFTSANDVQMTGYIWQKYDEGLHDDISRGIVFSEAESMEIIESYRHREMGTEIIRWFFRTTLRERLGYSKYPLDHETLRIKVLHKDLDHNVVLVPDLKAYKIISPTLLPGLEEELFIPGWKLESSLFELRKKKYLTNFGIERSVAKENFPILSFNIMINRNFINAFISNLTPLIIVSILLFGLQMMSTKDEKMLDVVQVSTGRVLSICIGIFFVVAFSHIGIRGKISAQELFYLEYFYFVFYAFLLFVSANSIIFTMSDKNRLIQYKDNLIAKLMYWPLLLGSLFIITMVVFY